jgi:hypothetical protein
MINVQFSNSGLHMSSRRFGSQSLVRLLGHWQQTSSRIPLWRQLADALRLLILDGRLALNTRLPGERSWPLRWTLAAPPSAVRWLICGKKGIWKAVTAAVHA